MAENDVLVKRLDSRPGYKVVSYREVGLPIFEVSALLTLQEQAQIGPLEEFTLKCLHLGLDTLSQLQQFLGLPTNLIATQLGALTFEQAARQVNEAGDQFALTPKGLHRLDELSTVKVSKEDVQLYVDGITRELTPVERSDLYSGAQLEGLGVVPVMPSPRKPPKPADIGLHQINRLFGLYASEDQERRHAVKLHGFVRPSWLLFRRGLAIAYKSENGRTVTVGFAVDGRLSDDHEIAYVNSGAAERSALMKELFDSGKRRQDIQAANKHLQEVMPGVALRQAGDRATTLTDTPPDYRGRKVLTLRRATPQPTATGAVKTLSVYEHPPLLDEALESAKSRLLIISPWIRAQVVNDKFLTKLDACLARRVAVTIAYGFGRDRGERPEDEQCRKALEKLAERFKNFRLIRKGNVHAKVLLVDERFFVTTSFNWLSFRGDPRQPMREEEGTYVEDVTLVNDYFAKLDVKLSPLPHS